jgi:hypothetical protein
MGIIFSYESVLKRETHKITSHFETPLAARSEQRFQNSAKGRFLI